MDAGTLSRVRLFLDSLRPEIRDLPRYNAGLSIDYVRKHYGVNQVAKLGSNENPYGPSRRVQDAIVLAAAEAALYPEPSCDPLREELAKRLQVAPERLIFGNGSEDLIAVAMHTFVAPGQRVVTFAPSFGLHVIWAQSVGADVRAVTVNDAYTVNIDEVLVALTPETRMIIFGNPSNPVGSSITASDLRSIVAHLSPETLLVFDEAYMEYAAADFSYPDFAAILRETEVPWLHLRTFSKAYGLAGLRVGYAVASAPELIGLMDRVRAPFNVNRLAQAAAIAALDDLDYMKQVVTRTVAERGRMRARLESLGYRVAPSLANFLFVQARENAADLAKRLLTRGVIVKPWQEPAYQDHLRVSIGLPQDNDQFLTAWKELAR
jgi:histidinol-phosphate aminotransferase